MELLKQKRVVLITGGARGIGYHAAQLLGAEGATLALVDINEDAVRAAAEQLSAVSGATVRAFAADIADPVSVGTMANEVKSTLGPVEILINSAAVVDDKLFLESDFADWDRMIKICLFGPMNLIKAFAPDMVSRQFGRIICLASDSARLGQARLSYYAAAKAGVVALCKSVAQELGPSGITVNVVSPGATNTELRQAREASLLTQMGEEKYARRQQSVLKMYPLKRIGEPHDIASMIAFVASDHASWLTGQIISVNGGFAMP
ncbi:MAG TPA: SDR family oxidoreductase [Steroidobacteraceae bacterium]|nr:SDR family oxidoreductase [Steroidobacteraceae bacterium]